MINQKNSRKFVILSNLFYLLPLGLALYFMISPLVFTLTGLIICSTWFHLYRTRVSSFLDTVFAYLTLIVGLVYTAPLVDMDHISHIISILMFVSLAVMIRYYLEDKSRDDMMHGIWHINISIILVLVLWCIWI